MLISKLRTHGYQESDQTEQMPMMIKVLSGHTYHHAGLVMHCLISKEGINMMELANNQERVHKYYFHAKQMIIKDSKTP